MAQFFFVAALNRTPASGLASMRLFESLKKQLTVFGSDLRGASVYFRAVAVISRWPCPTSLATTTVVRVGRGSLK